MMWPSFVRGLLGQAAQRARARPSARTQKRWMSTIILGQAASTRLRRHFGNAHERPDRQGARVYRVEKQREVLLRGGDACKFLK